MSLWYANLRDSILILASPAQAQVEYLDYTFRNLTNGKSAACYGNDELLLEFDDYYVACEYKHELGEITQAEIDAARSVAAIFGDLRTGGDKAFWRREALFSDPRWEQIRECAAAALEAMPDRRVENE
ncbi:hypothetical protein [Qipengyuania vesicularis]|uniref:hypothetical protein n=1 Tax=Qipengyuania vesicularis TaxID=2867232 RepID=UPI001C8700D0|nr:hypothetical protein [Qipengyuania vesicularis]MBX7526481.1 hypothetical protein [Qipengyuania vesicularis]